MGAAARLVVLLLLAGLGPVAAPEPEAPDALDGLESADVTIRLHFPEARLGVVLDALGRVGRFEVTFDGDEPETTVSVDWSDLTLREALSRLREDHGLSYRVPSKAVLVVVYPPPGD